MIQVTNLVGNHACIFFLAVVELVQESEALNVVSGVGDTVLIGKTYLRYRCMSKCYNISGLK